MSNVVVVLISMFLLVTSFSGSFLDYSYPNWVEYVNFVIILIIVIHAFMNYYINKNKS